MSNVGAPPPGVITLHSIGPIWMWWVPWLVKDKTATKYVI